MRRSTHGIGIGVGDAAGAAGFRRVFRSIITGTR
jgi:hypothetical protein